MTVLEADLRRAASAISLADALVFTAGAGMGVDSGLPDFRGDQGFWNAYPAYAKLGLSFAAMANPTWFRRDPHFAWGFYGHRLALYRATRPHPGFEILLRWARERRAGGFVFTSNVDGQFQRAGVGDDRIVECHGAIDWMQCMSRCGVGIFSAKSFAPDVDGETFRARDPLPVCPRCGGLARPNILMFGDDGWDDTRTDEQRERLSHWLGPLQRSNARVTIVECGAGEAIPTVRAFGERMARSGCTNLVRINLREHEAPVDQVGLPLGAHSALTQLDALVGAKT